MRALGVKLHPPAVVAAWYEQDCPPTLDMSSLSRWVHVQWWVSRRLRGVR